MTYHTPSGHASGLVISSAICVAGLQGGFSSTGSGERYEFPIELDADPVCRLDPDPQTDPRFAIY